MFCNSVLILVIYICCICQVEGTKLAKTYFGGQWHDFIDVDVGNDGEVPPPPIDNNWMDPNTVIYVSISHYRDFRCPNTLSNMFSKAKNPSRLSIGLIQQLRQESKDTDCVTQFCELDRNNCNKYKDQIHSMEMSALDSKGPSFSRFLHSYIARDEEYILQIDSHMDFVRNWDEILMMEWGAANNENAVLSTAPYDVSANTGTDEYSAVPFLCEADISGTSSKLVKNLPAVMLANVPKGNPVLSPLWSSSFSFSKSHFLRRVPPDPYLLHAYDGVEFTIMARLWTRGYDVYAPSQVIVFHDYEDKMGTKAARDANARAEGKAKVEHVGWTENGMSPWHKRKMFMDSRLRVETLLLMDNGDPSPLALASLTRFGLGSARSLHQLALFSGVDATLGTTTSKCTGGLKWVKPSRNTDLDDPWGAAPEVRLSGAANIPLVTMGGSDYREISMLDISALWHSHQRRMAATTGSGTGSGSGDENLNNVAPAQFILDPIITTDAHEKASEKLGAFGLSWLGRSIDRFRSSLLSANMKLPNGSEDERMPEKLFKILLLLIPIVLIVLAVAFYLMDPSHYDSSSSDFSSSSEEGISELEKAWK